MNEWVKWSGLAFQLLASILLGLLVGKGLESYTQTAGWAAGGALIGTLAGLGLVLKVLLKPRKKK
jgi:F0F1-type ATP synthase assembly protein I